MQMYMLMVDYGKNYPGKQGPSGFQAVVDPEQTRRSIISEVRDLWPLNENSHLSLAFIKFIDGNFVEDVTDEIVREAQAAMLEAAE